MKVGDLVIIKKEYGIVSLRKRGLLGVLGTIENGFPFDDGAIYSVRLKNGELWNLRPEHLRLARKEMKRRRIEEKMKKRAKEYVLRSL